MQHSPAHPIARFARRVHEQLLELAHTDPMFMPTSEKKAALLELEQSRDLIAAIENRYLHSQMPNGDVRFARRR